MQRHQAKRALITGTGSGIGRAAALTFAHHGAAEEWLAIDSGLFIY